MNGRIILLVLLAAGLEAACVPIPLANPPPYREETIGGLRPGVSRADVVFTLGAPNFYHEGERVFVYASDEHKMGYVFILGNGTAGGLGAGSFAKRFLYVVEFDDDGLATNLEIVDLGMGMPDEQLGDMGYDEVVCTAWRRCFSHSGALLAPPPEAEVTTPD